MCVCLCALCVWGSESEWQSERDEWDEESERGEDERPEGCGWNCVMFKWMQKIVVNCKLWTVLSPGKKTSGCLCQGTCVQLLACRYCLVCVSPQGRKARNRLLWFLLTRWQKWQVIPGQTKRPPQGWSVSKIAAERMCLGRMTQGPCSTEARAFLVATGFVMNRCPVNMQPSSVWSVDLLFDSSTTSGTLPRVSGLFY